MIFNVALANACTAHRKWNAHPNKNILVSYSSILGGYSQVVNLCFISKVMVERKMRKRGWGVRYLFALRSRELLPIWWRLGRQSVKTTFYYLRDACVPLFCYISRRFIDFINAANGLSFSRRAADFTRWWWMSASLSIFIQEIPKNAYEWKISWYILPLIYSSVDVQTAKQEPQKIKFNNNTEKNNNKYIVFISCLLERSICITLRNILKKCDPCCGEEKKIMKILIV